MRVFDTALLVLYLFALYFAVFWFLALLEKSRFLKQPRLKLTKYPRVSVVVPAFNAADTIAATLVSVLKLNYPKKKLQLIVVNDGSTDSTYEEIERVVASYPERKIQVLSQKNKGKGAALNRALKYVTGKYFACLDADSEIDRLALRKMVAMFEDGDPRIAVITPAMKIKEPRSIFQKIQRVEYLFAIFINRIMALFDSIYVAPGPFSLYKTRVVRQIGKFDQKNLTEDQEIAYRMQKNHFKIKQCSNGYVYTNAPKNLTQLMTQRRRWNKGSLLNLYRYREMIFNRDYGHFGVFQMPLNIMTYILGIGLVFFFGYVFLWPVLKGFFDLRYVGFDLVPYISNFTLTFNLLSFDYTKLFIITILLSVSLLYVIMAHIHTEERLGKRLSLYILPFLSVYYIILSLIFVISVTELLLGKRNKW